MLDPLTRKAGPGTSLGPERAGGAEKPEAVNTHQAYARHQRHLWLSAALFLGHVVLIWLRPLAAATRARAQAEQVTPCHGRPQMLASADKRPRPHDRASLLRQPHVLLVLGLRTCRPAPAHAYRDRTRLTLVLGALGRGDLPMREADKAEVRRHWQHVAELTGQAFDHASSTARASCTTPSPPVAARRWSARVPGRRPRHAPPSPGALLRQKRERL